MPGVDHRRWLGRTRRHETLASVRQFERTLSRRRWIKRRLIGLLGEYAADEKHAVG